MTNIATGCAADRDHLEHLLQVIAAGLSIDDDHIGVDLFEPGEELGRVGDHANPVASERSVTGTST